MGVCGVGNNQFDTFDICLSPIRYVNVKMISLNEITLVYAVCIYVYINNIVGT